MSLAEAPLLGHFFRCMLQGFLQWFKSGKSYTRDQGLFAGQPLPLPGLRQTSFGKQRHGPGSEENSWSAAKHM